MSGYEEAGAADTGARGFPAFPARKGGRARGQSWWAKAWTGAMEDTSLDPEPLKRGRAVARSGRLGPVTVAPGRISAVVYDGGEAPGTVEVALAELSDDEWDLLWEKLAERPAELEAFLAGELPPDLLEAAEDARVRLLPGYGDLEPECGCDSYDHPCEHAAALCYQASWLLDEDPFLLLLMRGRDRATALDELKTTVLLGAMGGFGDEDEEEEEEYEEYEEYDDGEEGADEEAAGDGEGHGEPDPDAPGTDAREAYALPPVPLPAPPPLPEPPPAPEGTGTGLDADPMERLADDAAERARALLAHALGHTARPPAPLTVWQDTVRIAARADERTVERLARASGRAEELPRAAAAWRLAGAEGLAVLEESWTPERQATARARTELAAGWDADELPEPEVDENRFTYAERGLQLRRGRDGRWHPYRREGDAWWPAGRPGADPVSVLAELLEG
ncbi:hypothetical protein ACFUJ0_18500 [Streptomyces sp. NPDC057242]|uniref:SWIM zinc finger family protein n=1 Tax=unclassified Streptomyces TaxID=2593676 RepID=UPI003642C405